MRQISPFTLLKLKILPFFPFSQPCKETCISEVVRIGSLNMFLLSMLWKAKFSILWLWYFWWGCRGKLNLITIGSERVKNGIGASNSVGLSAPTPSPLRLLCAPQSAFVDETLLSENTLTVDSSRFAVSYPPGLETNCEGLYMDLVLDRSYFPDMDPTMLFLNDSACGAHAYNESHIVMRAPLESCGTTWSQSADVISFYNMARTIITSNTSITRMPDYEINFACSYFKTAVLSLEAFKPTPKVTVIGPKEESECRQHLLACFNPCTFSQPFKEKGISEVVRIG